MEMLVLVNGAPASGKSALAVPLAARLSVPLLAKDTIKEALFDILGSGDADWSHRFSDAAFEVMFAVAAPLSEVVLEANFRGEHGPRLLALADGGTLLEVHCSCPPDERRRRWSTRRRHPGHRDADHPEPPAPATPGPLALGPVLEVDTDGDLDVATVAAWVRRHGA